MKHFLLFFIPLFALPSLRAETLYGHKKYPQAAKSQLVEAAAYSDGRKIYLERKTAGALEKMISAAEKEGVSIKIISGFRSIAYQRGLFERAVKKRGSKKAAAKYVAPAGYSEHHTGRAVDLGDKTVPKTDLSESFENTAAYIWLKQNAPRYGFRLSFSKNNPQGVAYEPWHWFFKGKTDEN